MLTQSFIIEETSIWENTRLLQSGSVPDHPGLCKDKNAVDQTNLMPEVYSHDLHWCELSQQDKTQR
jgi:hypothetical protein